jgi:ribose transport system permease protein
MKVMKKLIGLALFLGILYSVLLMAVPSDSVAANNYNLGTHIGSFGIISLGAALVIIAGGIDLSIGSVVALSATLQAILLTDPRFDWPPLLAVPAVLAVGAVIGLIHGLLITKLKLPAFVVTLCGLFIYRGTARTIAGNLSKGLGNDFTELRDFLYTRPVFELPRFLVIFLILAGIAAVFLHWSVYGRYLYAIGRNEKAARYAGIPADRYKTATYVVCSLLASFAGILFLMENNSVQPSADGNFYELWAITGAVLGGCSLSGGDGTILGVIMGTALLRILPNLANMWEVPSELEFIIIGGALLVGAFMDEVLKSRAMTKTQK